MSSLFPIIFTEGLFEEVGVTDEKLFVEIVDLRNVSNVYSDGPLAGPVDELCQ